MTPAKHPRPPRGLSRRAGQLWRAVLADFDVEPAGLVLLEEACRSLDRADEAASVIAAEGLVTQDRYGTPKAHPAVDVEAKHRRLFAALVRQVGLDVDDVEPAPSSTRHGRARPGPRPAHLRGVS
jgi:phage terminase small subunit